MANISVSQLTRYNKKYWVARENGKIKTLRPVTESKIQSLQEARNIYKKTGTFYTDRFKSDTKLTNVTEVSETRPSQFVTSVTEKQSTLRQLQKPTPKPRQAINPAYVVEGLYEGRTIASRSLTRSAYQSDEEARNDAWDNFLRGVATTIGQSSDAEEGIRLLSKIRDVKEGWVYYR